MKIKHVETVVFCWMMWPSKKKVMADPRSKAQLNAMPFDGKPMIFGGFDVVLEA